MTVKQSLNIREVSIEIENQSSIKFVNPNNIVTKRFTEVHYKVLGSIIEKVSVVVEKLLFKFTTN